VFRLNLRRTWGHTPAGGDTNGGNPRSKPSPPVNQSGGPQGGD